MASRNPEPGPGPPGGYPPGPRGPVHARFTDLYRTWYPTVVDEALRHLDSRADAEDVAQRVFTRLLKNGGWWDIDHPPSYFRQAGYLGAMSLLRSSDEGEVLDAELEERLPDPSADPTRAVRRREALALVQDALDRFPERCGKVCRRRWIRLLVRREIAHELEIGLKAIDKQLARGRKKLEEPGVLELLSSFGDGGG